MNLYNKYYVPIIVVCYILGCIMSISFCDDNMISFHRDKSSVSFYDFLPFDRFAFIAKNNLIVAIRYVIFSILTFGIGSLLYSFYNGLIFGFVVLKGAKILTISEIAGCTLPHAITEMVGLSMAGYIGLVLSYSIFASRKIATFKKVINLSLFTLILIILSSILESYVSMDSN